MRLKRRKVVQCSTVRREKLSVVKKTKAGKNPWNKEAESLRWTESENAEINSMLARSGVSYSEFIGEVKRLYHTAAPYYEKFCAEVGEKPTNEGLADFAMDALERYSARLALLEKQWMH